MKTVSKFWVVRKECSTSGGLACQYLQASGHDGDPLWSDKYEDAYVCTSKEQAKIRLDFARSRPSENPYNITLAKVVVKR